MNPLEDAIVAMRPLVPQLPFKSPNSVRPLDPTWVLGMHRAVHRHDPVMGQPVTVDHDVDFGWAARLALPSAGARGERHDAPRGLPRRAGRADHPGRADRTFPGGETHRTNNATYPAATGVTIQRATNAAFTTVMTFTATGPTAATYSDMSLP